MNRRLAVFISYLFHPLMMSTYLFALIIWKSPHNILPIGFSPTGSVVLLGLVWVTTFLIPTLSLFILKLSGSISSMALYNRQERITPMIFTTVMYGITTYLFSTKVELGTMISVFLGIASLLLALATLITMFWKISAHTISVGGTIGVLIGVNQVSRMYNFAYFLIALFLLAGFVATSRLKLNAHTPEQVYAGFVLGVLVSFASYVLYVV